MIFGNNGKCETNAVYPTLNNKQTINTIYDYKQKLIKEIKKLYNEDNDNGIIVKQTIIDLINSIK